MSETNSNRKLIEIVLLGIYINVFIVLLDKLHLPINNKILSATIWGFYLISFVLFIIFVSQYFGYKVKVKIPQAFLLFGIIICLGILVILEFIVLPFNIETNADYWIKFLVHIIMASMVLVIMYNQGKSSTDNSLSHEKEEIKDSNKEYETLFSVLIREFGDDITSDDLKRMLDYQLETYNQMFIQKIGLVISAILLAIEVYYRLRSVVPTNISDFSGLLIIVILILIWRDMDKTIKERGNYKIIIEYFRERQKLRKNPS